MNRKHLSKQERLEVYNKMDGHCAYCGCELKYKDMQVDHVKSVRRYEYILEKCNSMENYLPACRMCNFYKSTLDLEEFRKNVQTLLDRLEKIFIYRLAKKYGLVQECKKPIQFYFEKQEADRR